MEWNRRSYSGGKPKPLVLTAGLAGMEWAGGKKGKQGRALATTPA